MKTTIAIGVGILLGTVGTVLLSLPSVEAHPSPTSAGSDELHMGVGGLTDNKNDACWVLEKREGQTRLALYKMVSGGATGRLAIQFEGVRQLDWDLKMQEMDTMKPKVKSIKQAWEKAQKPAQK
jgi:hypothetical protein